MKRALHRFARLFSACLLTMLAATYSYAEELVQFTIPSQPLSSAIQRLSEQSGIQILYPEDAVAALKNAELQGSYTVQQALTTLLQGSGLQFDYTSPDTIVVKRSNGVNMPAAPATLPALTVRSSSVATKTDTPILLIPQAVQVVPQEIMQDQKAQGLSDVVENVSSVQPLYAWGGLYDVFIIRGFANSAANFRNGIRIPTSKFDLANVDHVEVLKGPSSVLYGSADPGGLVNTVTKAPTAEPKFAIEQSVGSFDHYRTEASASGPVSDDRSLLYRVDFSYLNSESYRDLQDNDRTFVAPAFTWNYASNTQFNLSFEYTKDKLVYDSGVPAVGDGIADIPIERAFGTTGIQDEHEIQLIDFNFSHLFNDQWELKAGVLAYDTEVDDNLLYAFANLGFGDQLMDRYASFGSEDVSTDIIWLNLIGNFQTGEIGHRLLLGIDQNKLDLHEEFTDLYIDTINIYQPGPYNTNVDFSVYETAERGLIFNQDLVTRGIYAQDEITLNENLRVLAGLRYDTLDRELQSAYYSPIETVTLDDDSVSPRLGVVYQPEKWYSIYGSYVESFGPAFNYDQFNKNPPETAKQYEIGVKSELFDGRLISTIALYDLTKENIPTPHPTDPTIVLSIGEANSKGIEIDVQGRVSDSLNIMGSYAYTSTEITKDNSGNEGNNLPYVPDHQGSLRVKYDFQNEVLSGFSLGGGVYAATKRFGDPANSYSDGSYARLDLFGAYRMQLAKSVMTAQLNINNVTDAEYYNLRARWSNIPAEPLNVVGSIRLDF